MLKPAILLLLFFIISSELVFATHIIGGEIITTCTGGSTYEIKLILYRDCAGTVFDGTACIGVYDDDGDLYTTLNFSDLDISSVDISSPDPCIIIPPDLCIEQGIYTGNFTLPNTTESWDFVYQRCCRNGDILNIINPDEAGLSCWAHIPPSGTYECNSSPYFNNYPPSAICVGTDINFDYSATDPDGDSLVYKFITPYHGGSFGMPLPCPPDDGPPTLSLIEWEAGYSESYQVDATPALSINSSTGLLSGTPTNEGRYVVGIAVEEWRDGELLSVHSRDFQFNIQTCVPITIASTAEYVLDCEDFSVDFTNSSTGADEYLWDFGDGTTSTEFEPSHLYADTGSYLVMLIANPGYSCSDTFYATINIFNTLTAEFNFTAACTNDPVLFNDLSISTEAGEIISWYWDFGDGTFSTDANPEHYYTTGGTYTVILTVETDKGCISEYSITLTIASGPIAEFETENICFGEVAEFDNTSLIPADVILDDYSWTFGDGNISAAENAEHNYETPGTYLVTLIATSTNGCADTISHEIIVGELPYPDAGEDDTISYFELYTLNGSGNGTFYWTPEDLVSDPYIANPTIYPFESYAYILEVTSPDGCIGLDTVNIFVQDISTIDIPNAFSPNGDGLNDEIHVVNHLAVELLEFSIYTRWGELIFTTNQLEKGWDGKYEGKDAEIGSYIYVVRALDEDGENILMKGSIVLLR